MFVRGKKVYDHKFIRDENGECIITYSDCEFCSEGPSIRTEVCFNDDGFWDDTVIVDICSKCLINGNLYFDDDDLKAHL